MGLLKWVFKGLLLTTGVSSADFEFKDLFYKAELCYFLDGVLALFGLVVTGMYVKERFFETEDKPGEEGIYEDLQGQDSSGYAPLRKKQPRRDDPEAGKKPRRGDRGADKGSDRVEEETYTRLKPREAEYRELPKKKRPGNPDEVYQGLSKVTKDTYDSLKPGAAPPRKDSAAPPRKDSAAPPRKDSAAPPRKEAAAAPRKEAAAAPRKDL